MSKVIFDMGMYWEVRRGDRRPVRSNLAESGLTPPARRRRRSEASTMSGAGPPIPPVIFVWSALNPNPDGRPRAVLPADASA